MKQLLIVGLGGFLGSIGRYKLSGVILHHSMGWRFPVSTSLWMCLAAFSLARWQPGLSIAIFLIGDWALSFYGRSKRIHDVFSCG